ncbi:hypothetical protein R1flu_003907 [Riccia fluitans]|uniref:Uncharacterized protein n=1 Tax=Riccia fluitans TaxID=41844 RepID=A0ABD1YDS5_9MARC
MEGVFMSVDYLSKYLVTIFARLEEVGTKFYANFEHGPYHLNTLNDLTNQSEQLDDCLDIRNVIFKTVFKHKERQVRRLNDEIQDQLKISEQLQKKVKKLEKRLAKVQDDNLEFCKKMESSLNFKFELVEQKCARFESDILRTL